VEKRRALNATPKELISKLTVPEQNLSNLMFCNGRKPSHVKSWLDGLRLTQIMPSAASLYRAIPEIPRLKCDAKTRLEILELMRHPLQSIARGLTKEFLNQPVLLPESSKKTAIITLALYKHLLDGYLAVVSELTTKKMTGGKHQDIYGLSIHRALATIGLLLLRSNQMYSPIPKGLWQNAHVLFQLAETFNLSDFVAQDEYNLVNSHDASNTFIRSNYARILMLDCSHPNQLGQNDLSSLYDAFEKWSVYLKLTNYAPDHPNVYWLIDVNTDSGPYNKTRPYGNDAITDASCIKSIILSDLIAKLDRINKELKFPLSPILLDHIKYCWELSIPRPEERRRTKGEAEVVIGLGDIHIMLSQNKSFEQFLNQEAKDNNEDISLQGITPNKNFDAAEEKETSYSKHVVTVQNMSKGGFCVLWKGETPNKLEAGEILALKDTSKRPPLICAVRWLRLCKQGVQLGLQIITDKATPFAVAQTYDTGGYADFTRALYVSASSLNDNPATLLTFVKPFQSGDRIKIHDGKEASTVYLSNSLYATRCIQQFSFSSSDKET